jgi:protein phosphatase PTC1
MLGDSQGEQWGYYAVYDGHGGSSVVDYVVLNLHEVIHSELKAAKRGSPVTDARVAQALQKSFYHVDEQLKAAGWAWKCGSTVTVALVQKSGAGLRLHLANVGDSSAVLIDSNFQGHMMSYDHRPTDVKEQLRIEAEGGFVARGRVSGQLGVSRALGDHWLKTAGVTGSPYIVSRDISKDLFMVLASDGLWDVMRDVDVAHIVEQSQDMSPERMSDLLVREAQRRGSTDNISCVVCALDKAVKSNSLAR